MDLESGIVPFLIEQCTCHQQLAAGNRPAGSPGESSASEPRNAAGFLSLRQPADGSGMSRELP
jgi:hypothetical protein